MEWSEFMQYIIDAVDGNNIRGGEGKETVAEQLEAIKALKYKRFQLARNVNDKSAHSSEI